MSRGGRRSAPPSGCTAPAALRSSTRSARTALPASSSRAVLPSSSSTTAARISPMTLSWRSFYDMANPNGDYNVFPFYEVMAGLRLGTRLRFRHVRAIRKPSLYVYGDRDEFSYGDVPRCASILAENVGANA